MFSTLSKSTLAKAFLCKDAPIYVQFYVTARPLELAVQIRSERVREAN
jgi:hypothetical protein